MSPFAQGISWFKTLCIPSPDTTKHISNTSLDFILEIAFSVSKKYGKAFERNKAKRIARAITSKVIKELKNINIVIVIKYNSKGKKYDILEKELLSIFKTIVLKQLKGDLNENKKII